jgi:acetoin utilization protein AcuB
MTTDVISLPSTTTLEDAVQIQLRHKIRHIPIIVEESRLVGILTDRDLKRAMPSLMVSSDRAAYDSVMTTTVVAQIMIRNPLTVTPDTPLKEAVRILHTTKFGALPVVEEGRLVGLLSQSDVVGAFLALLEAAGSHCRSAQAD